MDVVRPARRYEAVGGALHENVAQMERVEDAGIVDRDGRSRGHG